MQSASRSPSLLGERFTTNLFTKGKRGPTLRMISVRSPESSSSGVGGRGLFGGGPEMQVC